MPLLKAVDLFSGVGCFSYAFKHTFQTVLYCEVAPECRSILKANMKRGYIDSAEIIKDVKKLHNAKGAHVLTAGFPCQDLSLANKNGKGLEGKRSGLFFEIIRVIAENPSICHVFMENVPALMSSFDVIMRSFQDLGFTLKYVIVSASQVGAPHLRRRVFIYATRKGAKHRLPFIKIEQMDVWKPSTQPPMSINKKFGDELKRINQRHKACGNAIVPACIKVAYNHLVHGKPLPQLHRPISNVLKDGDMVIRKHRYSTPNASFLHPYRTLTKRGTSVFCNDVKFNVHNKFRGTVNPRFSEWVMGMPSNFTKAC